MNHYCNMTVDHLNYKECSEYCSYFGLHYLAFLKNSKNSLLAAGLQYLKVVHESLFDAVMRDSLFQQYEQAEVFLQIYLEISHLHCNTDSDISYVNYDYGNRSDSDIMDTH